MFNRHRNLGLALCEHGLAAAQLDAAPKGPYAAVALAFTPELNLSDPQRLGKELRQQLRRAGIRASHCTIGLSAAWTAAREKLLPPADGETIRGALNIAAEREFASGPQDLVFDYTCSPAGKGLAALLAAAPRGVLAQATAMAAAAGLRVSAVTSTIAALGAATKWPIPPAGRLVLCLLPDGVELAVQSPAGMRTIRHWPIRPDRPDGQEQLAGELARLTATLPSDGPSGTIEQLCLWNAAGWEPGAVASLAKALPFACHACRTESDMTFAAPATIGQQPLAPALALATFEPSSGLNFLAPRLAPARTHRLRRPAAMLAAAGFVVLAAAVWLFVDGSLTQRDAELMKSQLDGMRASTDSAQALVDNVGFASAWFDRRPGVLDALREVTQAFPDEGRVWATNLIVRDDLSVQLTGKSVSETAALEVIDRLKANRRLAGIKPLYIRQAGGSVREVSFAVSLTFRGNE